MKKFILSLGVIIASQAAQARPDVVRCVPETKPAKGEVNYLIVRDIPNHKISMFSKEVVADPTKDMGWQLVGADSELSFPMDPRAKVRAAVGITSGEDINWDLHRGQCFVLRSYAAVEFEDIEKSPYKITVQVMPQIFSNPNMPPCPVPMPMPGPKINYICSEIQ